MERRKFLIGVGSLAAGTAAAMGTGAFASRSDRNANIQTVSDDKGLIALKDATDGEIVRQREDGELVVDFSANGNAGGVNTNSQYQIGLMPPGTPGSVDPLETAGTVPKALDDPAFKIVNQTTEPKAISLELTSDSLPSGQLVVGLSTNREADGGFGPNEDAFGIGIVGKDGSSGSQTDTANVDDVGKVGVKPGNVVGVAMLVNADKDPASSNREEALPGDDLSTTLRIEAKDT